MMACAILGMLGSVRLFGSIVSTMCRSIDSCSIPVRSSISASSSMPFSLQIDSGCSWQNFPIAWSKSSSRSRPSSLPPIGIQAASMNTKPIDSHRNGAPRSLELKRVTYYSTDGQERYSEYKKESPDHCRPKLYAFGAVRLRGAPTATQTAEVSQSHDRREHCLDAGRRQGPITSAGKVQAQTDTSQPGRCPYSVFQDAYSRIAVIFSRPSVMYAMAMK